MAHGLPKSVGQNRGESTEVLGKKMWQICSVLRLGRAMTQVSAFLKDVTM